MVKQMLDQATSLSLQPHPFICTDYFSVENSLLISSASLIQFVAFLEHLETASEVTATVAVNEKYSFHIC